MNQPSTTKDEDAPAACPLCGRQIAIQPADVGMPISCPGCRGMLRVERDAASGRAVLIEVPLDEFQESTPWDEFRIGGPGGAKRVLQAYLGIMRSPRRFFRKLPSAGLKSAFAFGVATVVASLLPYVLYIAHSTELRRRHGDLGPRGPTELEWPVALAMAVFMLSLVSVAGALVASTVSHVVLILTGCRPAGLKTTCKVYAYALATYASATFIYAVAWYGLSAMLPPGPVFWLVLNPCYGFFAAVSWMMIVVVIGLREAHRVSVWRAVVAAIVPFGMGFSSLVALLLS